MRFSWKIGEVSGIGIFIHATFFLLLAWVGLTYFFEEHSLGAALAGVGFILLLFTCVVLHELGHALTAKRFGIKTRDITLLPIGGVARLERIPEEPRQEFLVALAGPAVNIVLAAFLFAWIQLVSGLQPLTHLGVTHGSLVGRLMVVNLFLAAFNMLPAFPMDGGRVVRALLAMRMEYTKATHIAAVLGQGLALVFGFVGFFTNPFLVFIAFFVWIGAAQESSLAQMKSALGGIPVSQAMVTEFHTLSPNDPLGRVVELILSGSQHDFPVTDNGRVVGVLTHGDVMAALARQGQAATVGEVMKREFQTVEAYEMLETAFRRLQICDCHTLPVTRGGALAGLLTSDNMGEFLMIQTALSRSREHPPRERAERLHLKAGEGGLDNA